MDDDQNGVTDDVVRAAGSTVEVYVNSNTPTLSFSASGLQQLAIDGGGGDDAVIVTDDPAGTGMADLRQHQLAGRILTSVTQIKGRPATLARIDNRLIRQSSWNGSPVSASGSFAQVILTHARLGDLDLDGQVTEADYGPVVANLGMANAQWALGDANDDGIVTLDDFAVVTSQLAATASDAPALATTPPAPAPVSSEALAQVDRSPVLPSIPSPANLTRPATPNRAERRTRPTPPKRWSKVHNLFVMTEKSSTERPTGLVSASLQDIFELDRDRRKARLRTHTLDIVARR